MNLSPSNWKSNVYIAKRLSVTNTNGRQTNVYDTPTQYSLNVQPLNEQTRIELFGANDKKMYRAMSVNVDYDINELDVVYLDDASPNDETTNGASANYIVRLVQKSNVATTYYFESKKG